jgi:hypothetical protein
MKVIKFTPGLIPVFKHQEHDQSSHGSWAGDSVSFKQDRNSLTMQDKNGNTLASVDFVNLGNNRLDIDSIDSFDEGKGYATKVLEKLYSSFPEHSIFWGKTIVPASTHLAQKFSDKYGRTEFMPWGEGVIAGYEWGQLYGDTTVKKHQQHDQSSHGNWAEGSEGSSKELADGEIQDILHNSKTIEEMYQKVAERLGKSLKPKVAVIPEGEENLYRGLGNPERDAQQLVDGRIPFTPFQTWGQGIYATPHQDDAKTYGQVVRMKLDDSANILRTESEAFAVDTSSTPFKSDFVDFASLLPKITSGEVDNFSISDAYNIYWAAKGYDGYQPHGGEIVLFNATHLTVNKTDIGTAVQKHQEHDQSTHGNWALSENYPDLLTLGAFDEESEYDPALMVYSERYGVDKDGKIVGVETFEHDGIDYYSQEGYKNINSYLRNPRGVEDRTNQQFLQQHIDGLDSLIDKAPDMFGDKTLFRVVDDFVLEKLTPGDTFRDKGFLSTTRIDITRDTATREALDLYESPDTVAVILPSPTKSGKGIAVDLYRTSVNDTSSVSDREKEVLLPRDTELLFLGYKRGIGAEEKVAVFQRVDK